MTSQEIEVWTRQIVAAALSGQATEDARVELKAEWIDPQKAARGLAAHANAAGGSSILWIIGVNEKERTLMTPRRQKKPTGLQALLPFLMDTHQLWFAT
ncbi:MAG TPA: hypothetical protein VKD91_03475 [Pyrinomonadaceae bacterium]|nr:hypothetical protein [Pyrinomonadaceae bacterium]